MTWVVAGNGFLYPFIAGDIRVTFQMEDVRRVECDCLQKIHPVARNIWGGFAGSVYGGFALLHAVRQQLYEDHWYSLPQMVYRWMPRLMRRVHRLFPIKEQALGNQLIMLGAHPTLTRGDIEFPRCHTFRFTSPQFEPECATAVECLGIGSGDSVEKYRSAATKASGESWFRQTVVAGLKWPAHTMASTLHRIVSAEPVPEVSPWFLYGTVSLTEWIIEAYAYTAYQRDGVEAHGPPPIVQTYDDFRRFCVRAGMSAEAAVAPFRAAAP